MVALDGVAEGARHRLSIDQMHKVIFGELHEGSFAVVRHSTEEGAGVEGRPAHAVGGCFFTRHSLGGGGLDEE